MSFKKKANKALALLLSLSLAMSINMPVSVLADETAAPETEPAVQVAEAAISYATYNEEVKGIHLNSVPVIIEEAKDVSGNTIADKFSLIHDADRDGIADAGEEKLDIDGVTEFDSTLNVYGTYRTDAVGDILITMNSGEVGNIYGSNDGDAENVRIVVNGGVATGIYGLYNDYSYSVVSESLYIYVAENVTLTKDPAPAGGYMESWSYFGDIYASWGDKLWVSDGYVFENDLTLSYLEIITGKVTIPKGVTVKTTSVSGRDYHNSPIIVIKGKLEAESISSSYGKYVLDGGTFTGAVESSTNVYEPLYLEYSIENVPVKFSSGEYNTVSLEEDGITKYYLRRSYHVVIDASLQGYDVYYSINGGEDTYTSDGTIMVNMRGENTVHVEYVPKQITVANNFSAPKGMVGVTYTAETPLVDLAIYPVSNDTEEGQVRYAVKKSTPLPEGLSLVKGKIIGTPKVSCPEGQKVTVVVTGRNGTTAELTLEIKVFDNIENKSINETVYVDQTNSIIDLRGTSVVVLDDPNKSGSDYVNIYADADRDGLPDNKEALLINESSSVNLYNYTLIGWQGINDDEGKLIQAAYDGDIRITLKSGRVRKTYGVYGEGKKDIAVNGHVYLCLENGYGGIPVCGVYYGKAEDVTVEVIGGGHTGGTIYGVDHATVTGDVNYTFGKMAYTTYNKENLYLTQYVTSASTVEGDVNVSLGFTPNSTGLGQEGLENRPYYARFYGVSATKVTGDVNYTIDGKFTPGTFNMVEKSGDEKSTVKGNLNINWKSGNIGSPVVLTGSDVEKSVIIKAEENADISATYLYVCNDSATADHVYVNIPASCSGTISNISNTNGYKSSLFVNRKGVVTVSGTYELNKDLAARSMMVQSNSKVTIAEGVTVEGLSLVDTGATVINNGILKTTALSINGTVINRESGKWTVEGVVTNKGKIVNYGSFVQTCSANNYDKLGAVYTTMPLTLYQNPAEAKYAFDGYSDLYYAVHVSWPTHCASKPVLTGTVTSGVEGDTNQYIRISRSGNGNSPFSITPGAINGDKFELESVVYGPENTETIQESNMTYTGDARGVFEPVGITLNYKATDDVPKIVLNPNAAEISNSENEQKLVVDKTYTYEEPLYDLTTIAIENDLVDIENGKVLYSVATGSDLPEGFVLKDGKFYGTFTTATNEDKVILFNIKGLNQTTKVFTLTLGPVAKAVPDWSLPIGLTGKVGQMVSDVQLPMDPRGDYTWETETQSLDRVGTAVTNIIFTPNDEYSLDNYDWAQAAGGAWDAENERIYWPVQIEVGPGEPEVTAPTGLTATYGQMFADVEIPADENGTFTWDENYHALTDTVGDAGETTCYVTYHPTDTSYTSKSGIEVTLTVAPATPDYKETLTQVEVLCDEELGDVLLPDVDGGRYQWVTSTATKPEDGKAYSVIYLPEDTVNYDWTTVDGWHKYRKGVVFSVVVKITHAWDEGVVTVKPTKTSTGKKLYSCGLCDETKTEILDKLPDDSTGGGTSGGTTGGSGSAGGSSGINSGQGSSQPKVGYTISDKSSKAVYKVSKVCKEVTYVKPNKKTYTKAKIPNTIKYEGVTYKVTAIANNAFKSNKKLKSVAIGSNVKTIGTKAFYGCTKLTAVTIGSKVTTIGNSAFQSCTALKSITIPKNVSKIGSKAFYGCKKLTKMTIKTSKLTEKKVGKQAFTKMGSSNYKKTTVKVPKKKLKTYKKMLVKYGLSKKAKVKK